MNQEKINLFQARDFGETFNVTIKFLRQNFKSFFKSLIFIAGPLFLLSTLFGIYYQTTVNSGGTLNSFAMLANIFNWKYFVTLFLSLLAGLTLMGTTFSYLICYNKNGPGNVNTSDVASLFIKNIGKIVGGFFLLLLLIVIIGFGAFFIIGLIASIHTAIAILMGFIVVIGLLILGPPFIWQFSTFYLPMMHDEDSVINSLSRIREVMRGEFWWTWLLMVCNYIMVIIISMVILVPQLIYTVVIVLSGSVQGYSSLSFIIVSSVCTFLASFIYSIYYLVNAFHYYSLAEKKEGIGLMERINEIGAKPNNDEYKPQF